LHYVSFYGGIKVNSGIRRTVVTVVSFGNIFKNKKEI
jgi:hypothetical protein